MPRLNSTQFKQIQTALLDAYASDEDLAQMVRLELGENLDEIAGGRNLRDQVFTLVLWAERVGRLNDLVCGALAHNPGNSALQELTNISFQPSLSLVANIESTHSTVLHDIPFIGPIPFSSETADLFFGRDADVERLAAKLLTRGVPLIIVNGLSGSGKTSLLRAGLIPMLEQRGVRSIYVSILDSPHADLLHALRRASVHYDEHDLDGIQVLNRVIEGSGRNWTVLIIDQLERCFNNSQTKEDQLSFWRDIGRILRGDTVSLVKVILCVRSDWLHAFQTVSPSPVDIPVFNYLFLVEPLTEEQAREALMAPFHKFHVSIEDEVIDEIVADLITPEGYVYPPQLQVVGSTLYEYLEQRRTGEQHLRLSRRDYAALQGASSILRQHLVRILKSLGPHENLGWQILLRLVSDDDIRVSQHEDELRGSFNEEVFQPIVESLVEYALIVRDVSKVDGRHVYTLTHDYLIGEVKARFQYDHRLQALKTSEHYLESGLDDNRRAAERGAGFLPLEYERYSHIWRHREALEWVNPAATEFLSLSALWHGDSTFVEWFARLPVDCEEQAAAKIQDICWQQVERGDTRPVDAIEAAAKQNLSPKLARILAAILWRLFAGLISVDSAVAARGDSVHGREVFAGALWTMRKSLPPRDLVSLSPTLAQLWLRKKRVAVLSGIGGILVFAIVLSVAWFIQEQMAGTWVPIAPLRAGLVNSFVAVPGNKPTYFAATNNGRFVSEGSTVFQGDLSDLQWSALGGTLVSEPIQALAIASSNDVVNVFAAVRGRGIYRWRDQSEMWTLINRGLNSYDISDIAVDPTDPETLYAAAANYSGVFQTRDGGDTWVDVSGGALFGVSVTTLAFSFQEPGWVVAGTSDGRIFRKQRDATDWQAVAAFPGSGAISALAWDSDAGMTLLAGTTTGKIYVSIDGGGNWLFLSDLPNVFVIASIAILPGQPEKAFLVAYGVGGHTIWHSIDEVYTWEPVENLDFSREFMRLAAGPQGTDQLFAYGAPGLFVTEDEGASWRWLSNLGAPLAAARKIVFSPLPAGPTYLQLDGSVFVTQNITHFAWTRSSGLPALAVRDLAPHPTEPNLAYAGIYLPNRWSFYVTRDAGSTWEATAKPTAIPERFLDDVTAVAVSTQGDQTVFYLGTASCGVLNSSDNGESWETFGRTDCDVQNGPYAVNDIAVASHSIDTVYVAADNALVYRSTDRGRTWKTSRLPISGRINGLVADQQVPGRLYAIARGDGFWRSDDGGDTWRNLSVGIKDRPLIDIVVTATASRLYVAAINGDVWVSSNGGETWQSIRRNLSVNNTTSIALMADDETLVLTTIAEGLYLLHKGFGVYGGPE